MPEAAGERQGLEGRGGKNKEKSKFIFPLCNTKRSHKVRSLYAYYKNYSKSKMNRKKRKLSSTELSWDLRVLGRCCVSTSVSGVW